MSTEQEVQALLRAEQAVRPALAAVEQGWQRLALDLAANVAPAPAPVATGAIKLSAWLVPKWIVLGFAVGVAGIGASSQMFTAPAAPLRAPTVSVVPASPTRAPTALSTAPAIAPSFAPAARALPSAAKAESALAPANFDAELELISLAKSELDAHRPDRASAALREHAARFPSGVFAAERDALQALADCQRGPKSDAVARAFAARHPGSPLLDRVSRGCTSAISPNEPLAPRERTTEPSRGDQR